MLIVLLWGAAVHWDGEAIGILGLYPDLSWDRSLHLYYWYMSMFLVLVIALLLALWDDERGDRF